MSEVKINEVQSSQKLNGEISNWYNFKLPETLQFESGIKDFTLRMPTASICENIYDNLDDVDTPLDINKKFFCKMLIEVDGKTYNEKGALKLWQEVYERTQEAFAFAVNKLNEPLQSEMADLLKTENVSVFHGSTESGETGVFYKFAMPENNDFADLVDFKTITLRGLKVFEVDEYQKTLQKETNIIKSGRMLFLKMCNMVDDKKLNASEALVFWNKLPERYRRLILSAVNFVRRPSEDDLSDFLSSMTVVKQGN